MKTFLLVAVVALGIFWIVSYLRAYFKARAIYKYLETAVGDMGLLSGMLAVTPDQIFEHNFRVLQKSDPLQAFTLPYVRIMEAVHAGKNPRKDDVERLQILGRLKSAHDDCRALYPDAKYEIDGAVRGRVFFREDLTLAGYNQYEPEVSAIIERVFGSKCLSVDDLEFLRRTHYINENMRWADEVGKPKASYRDEPHYVWTQFRGEKTRFFFNESFAVMAVVKGGVGEKNEVLWELEGAYQQEAVV